MPRYTQFVGIWNWDVTNDLVSADPSVAHLFGVSVQDAENGTPIEEFFKHIHQDDIRDVERGIQRSLYLQSDFWAIYRVAVPGTTDVRVLARGKVHPIEDGLRRFSGMILKIGEDTPAEPELAIETSAENYLGPRELQCLEWCSRGKTNWEIGQILGITERTVEHHIASATRKLTSTTRTQAVAEAIRGGLIA